MNINDLFIEEQATIEAIHQLKAQILEKEFQKENYELDLWVNTNFKSLNLTNSDQRKAYVKSKMADVVNQTGSLKNDLLYSENYLKMIRDKQKFMLEFHLEEFPDE